MNEMEKEELEKEVALEEIIQEDDGISKETNNSILYAEIPSKEELKEDLKSVKMLADEEVTQEDEEIIEEIIVQVETKQKKSKFAGNKILASILKLTIGIYLIGVIVGVNEILVMRANPLLEAIHSSSFMNATLVPWADILFGPVRFMASLLSWFTPVIMLNAVLFFVLSKIKWISKKELKIFAYIMIVALLLVF